MAAPGKKKRKYVRHPRTGPTAPPERTSTHRIDTRAVQLVDQRLPVDWLKRDFQERDYGIDMVREVFKGDRPTGSLLLFQIKGHEAACGDPISMQVPVKTLLYAEMFGMPFILVYVSLADSEAYYVWLQKYIKTRLHLDSPNWRSQDKVTITFPSENVLDDDGVERISVFAQHHAKRDVGIQFLWHSTWMSRHVEGYRQGNRHQISEAVAHAEKMAELASFWGFYSDFTEKFDLADLLKILKKAEAYRDHGLEDEDEQFLDSQLEELGTLQVLFLSGDDLEAFVVENCDDHVPY